eukprot:1191106-Prorocentrum_minimum.AAC.1
MQIGDCLLANDQSLRVVSDRRCCSGILAGAGGGMSQVVIMGPCTYLVTAAVTGDKSVTTSQRVTRTWNTHGLKGFYPGGTAIAFRQVILPRFTGPPVPITARVHSTPQRPFPFSHPVPSSPLSPTSLSDRYFTIVMLLRSFLRVLLYVTVTARVRFPRDPSRARHGHCRIDR